MFLFFLLENYTLTQQTLLLTYESWTHTLRDLSTYSPYAIDGSHLRLLFIIYQLLKIISFIHQRGLSCGPIQLTDIHINERYWIQLKPRFQSCLATIDFGSGCGNINIDDDDYHIHSSSKPTSRANSVSVPSTSIQKRRLSNPNNESSVVTTTITSPPSPTTISHSPVYHVEHRYETYCRTHIDIVELIKQWQLGHISNFDYLLILNALAGRKFHDPNNHLIFPWINDFTSSTYNLRDLSQSKYRLNKGDAQLDLTYNYYSTSISSTTHIVPHHLSEHLSPITYYVYKARRTDKRILCEVRYWKMK
jgi:WD repeat-containing protein 81